MNARNERLKQWSKEVATSIEELELIDISRLVVRKGKVANQSSIEAVRGSWTSIRLRSPRHQSSRSYR